MEYKTKGLYYQAGSPHQRTHHAHNQLPGMYWGVKNASTDHDDELIFSITADEFNEYQNSLHMKCLHAGTSAPITALWNPMIHAPDPLTEFRKGIKQDPSIFPTLKDINQ